jgi:DNA-binding CsgD family transcriptional regulator
VTVKAHLQNIYRKLDARGRIEALIEARELGLIPRD